MTGTRKTALITGAASGIGRASAERLAASGWNVVALDRDAAGLAWAQGAQNIATVVADVASEADNARAVGEAEARFGGLDALVLNAGMTGGGAIDRLPLEQFHAVVAVNMVGPVLGLRAALPMLRKGRDPAIVVTASTMGLAGDAENWAYGMTKHALIGLVRSLARKLGCEGIRINALCPGLTRTGMTQGLEDAVPEHFEAVTRQVPLQRWADPTEMAAVIEFLISPAASYVNGHAMVADGGALVGTGLLPPSTRPEKEEPAR